MLTAYPTIENPLIGDRVTFIQSCRSPEYLPTLVEVSLAPRGGNFLHYHQRFAETFTVKRGQLSIELDGRITRLFPGESATAPVGSLHRFFNETDRPVLFEVELSPGSPGFEQALCIGYGLARDGHCFSSGIPKKPVHLAIVLDLSESRLTGAACMLSPVISTLARWGRQRGIERALLERYDCLNPNRCK